MIIYGKHVALYALQHHPKKIQTVYLAKKGLLPQKLFDQYKPKIKFLENKWAVAMSKGGNHQGILVEIDDFEPSSFEQIKSDARFILVLDTLTDVGNIGAIVRSAYTLGVDAIIASGVKQLNYEAIARTSSGALLDMPFLLSENILDRLNELKQLDFTLYGAMMDGENINTIEPKGKKVLILGSEDRGISKRIEAKLDKRVAITMRREFNSLNVSVAAGILIDRMVDGES
ncbi:MAG: 23S rRNA (guanosine(2251)-2'-O)-methyltransferase RlmB [Campylobacterales bacterium]|nr:23S rRNA (guanosine(2251)-2'-O)-methyltransferase RlmB [Campylobacterales bacterium]